MSVMADEKKLPLNQIRMEDGAHELATTPDMKLYLEVLKAGMQGKDMGPHLGARVSYARSRSGGAVRSCGAFRYADNLSTTRFCH